MKDGTKTTKLFRKRATDKKSVNPFAIGGGFLGFCVSKGWLMQEGKGRNAKYFATDEGKEELKKFGIKL